MIRDNHKRSRMILLKKARKDQDAIYQDEYSITPHIYLPIIEVFKMTNQKKTTSNERT